MKEAIETRELFALDNLGVVLQGTCHDTCDKGLDAQSNLIKRDRVGLLFMNGLSAMRSAKGDSAVYWADSFAKRGYPSFRLDLPGFGDSEGDPPTDQLGFINQGGYGTIATDAIDELAARFNLSGIVIVAHCSGTVTAIYTAASSRKCRGLVLMDPYFYLPQIKGSKIRRLLHVWALQSRLEGLLINLYDLSKQLFLFFRGNARPDNANIPLLRCWKEIASSGLPILIFKRSGREAPGVKPRTGEFDYLKHILDLAGRKSQVVVRVTDGAHHSFANHLGRAAVRQHTEQWLDAYFPLADGGDSDRNTVCSEFGDSNMTIETVSGV